MSKAQFHLALPFLDHIHTAFWVYSDADWARCIETWRFTYGYSILLAGNLVSESAKKQPTVSRSSCESRSSAKKQPSVSRSNCESEYTKQW